MTPLRTPLKRGLTIGGQEYVLTLTPEGLKLTLKGKRNGFEMPWAKIVNGEAALAVALQASVGAFSAKSALPPKPSAAGKDQSKPRSRAGVQARRVRA
jgi:hypothetical protein